MQRPDEKKRALITATAARLFATRPYHKVRLDDIAAEAKIGKGTLYVYFDNKEDLYFSLIYEGFSQLIDRLREQIEPPAGIEPPAQPTAWQNVQRIVTELVRFPCQHPHFFELMRTVGTVKGHSQAAWDQKRAELQQLIEQTVRRGVEAGELSDPNPELTALFIPGMVRAAMLFRPKGIDETAVREQILRLLEAGIRRKMRKENAE